MDSELISLKDFEALEGHLLQCPPVDIPVTHTFAPGVYVRTAHFPAGAVALGHQHKTKHINLITKGHFCVMAGTDLIHFHAGSIFVADPGVRKLAYFYEDTDWSNVLPNPTDDTNVESLENVFVVKSQTFLEHQMKEIK